MVRAMIKKLIPITAIFILIMSTPLISATIIETETRDTTGIFDRSIIRGVVLFPRISDGGQSIRFFAVRLHYRTMNLLGTTSGVIRLRPIEIPNNLIGYIGSAYIIGYFKGSVTE